MRSSINLVVEPIRFRLLFFLLISFLLFSPYFGGHDFLAWALVAIQLLTLFYLNFYHSQSAKHFYTGLTVSLFAAIAAAIYFFHDNSYAYLIFCFFSMLIYSDAIYIIFKQVVLAKQINREVVFASLVVYILLGLLYGFIYILIAWFYPNSFVSASDLSQYHYSPSSQLIYYSFMTLTTVGYGDITPLSPYARSLAIIESMTGVLYLAVFVARLIAVFKQN